MKSSALINAVWCSLQLNFETEGLSNICDILFTPELHCPLVARKYLISIVNLVFCIRSRDSTMHA